MTQLPPTFFEFGPFRLDPRKRLLWHKNKIIALKSKVFETLLVLVQNHGRVLEKDELMRLIWPDAVVEENNLNKNISALRKLLGENTDEHRYILTMPGRGYNFVANVRELTDEEEEDELIVATRARITIRQEEELEEAVMHSVAVLPFKEMGTESGDEYLGLGLADALIMRLSKLRQIIVRPTSAIVRYATSGCDVVSIGRELSVTSVLEGSIRRAGNCIRVSAQLVGMSQERTLWAGQFDVKLTDIFAVEDHASQQIAQALALELTDEERFQLQQPSTENSEAYKLFLQSRYYLNQVPIQMEKMLDCLRQALAKDPNFALAHMALAQCYCFSGFFDLRPPRVCYPLAQLAVSRALELDVHLAEGYVALGRIKHEYEWDWEGAEQAFRRAIELSPNLAVAHAHYAACLGGLERREALDEISLAQALDPLSLLYPTIKGHILFTQRRYPEAISVLSRVLETDPAYYAAGWFLGMAYEQLGAYDEAIAVLERVKLASNLAHILPHLGHAYAVANRRAEAEQVLAELQLQATNTHVSPFAFVHIYTGLGKIDQAFEWLEKAYEARDPKLSYLKVHPRWDRLRQDARFNDLLRRLGLGLEAMRDHSEMRIERRGRFTDHQKR